MSATARESNQVASPELFQLIERLRTQDELAAAAKTESLGLARSVLSKVLDLEGRQSITKQDSASAKRELPEFEI
ncbi:MAG: hypothetical protein KDA85_13955 [Planctomycetaceae bacterium]|nr:hypothetical protein [Planctomycetaceae bacterium]